MYFKIYAKKTENQYLATQPKEYRLFGMTKEKLPKCWCFAPISSGIISVGCLTVPAKFQTVWYLFGDLFLMTSYVAPGVALKRFFFMENRHEKANERC